MTAQIGMRKHLSPIQSWRLKIVAGLAAAAFATVTPAHGKEDRSMNAKTTAVVSRYLRIVLVENNQGKGLEDILAPDFAFDDPFGKASSASEFIASTQRWIATKKTLNVRRQVVDGNWVWSDLELHVTTPSGQTSVVNLIDVVQLRDDRITKENVYFANPVQFAKDMGFLEDYLKHFQ